RVTTIAPLPDAQAAFMNPDLTIYNTLVRLDGNGNSELLRAGMGCTAEIIVEQHRETTYIPVQAVLRVGGKPTAHVVKGKELEPRKVEIGLDNNRMVRIISGLEPGEVVSLAPPLIQAAVEEPSYEKISDIPSPSPGPTPSPGVTQGPGTGSPQAVERGSGSGTPQRSASQPNDRSRNLDKDNDGKLSRDEFPRPEIFDRLDKDGDGYISKNEMPQRSSGRNRSGGGQQARSVPSGGGQVQNPGPMGADR
ncbi:hypothetical protein ACFL7M_14525, partial [Thermodesulfobacteriota bacterium]